MGNNKDVIETLRWSAMVQLAKSKGFELDPMDTEADHKWVCGVLDALSDTFDDLYNNASITGFTLNNDGDRLLMRLPYDLLRYEDCTYTGQEVNKISEAMYKLKNSQSSNLNGGTANKLDKLSREGYKMSHDSNGNVRQDEEVVSVEGAGMSQKAIEKTLFSGKSGSKSDSKIRNFLGKKSVKLSALALAVLVGTGAIVAKGCDSCHEDTPVTDAGEKDNGDWKNFDIFETKEDVMGDTVPDENPAQNPYDKKAGETAPENEDRTEVATAPIFDPVENGNSKPNKLNGNANTEKQTSKPSDNETENSKDPSGFEDFDIFEHIDG